MLQSGQQGARALLLGKHEIDDFHNAGYRVFGIAKKLQTHRTGVGGHAVHHPAGAGDQTVAALFLNTRQTAQKLVSNVLAQALLAKARTRNVQPLGALQCFAISLVIFQLKAGHCRIMNLAHVVVEARDFQPGSLRRNHAPRCQIIQRSTPQHGFLAARIHGNVAANAGGLGRRGVHRKHKATALGGISHALGHNARLGPDRGDGFVQTWQDPHLDLGHGLQLFGVDDRALPGERYGAARVACTPPAGDDRQTQIDATFDQPCHFGLGVRRQHDEGVFHAPVGCVGHMGHAA